MNIESDKHKEHIKKLAKAIEPMFPKNSRSKIESNWLVFEWKTNDDPNRPNKKERIIIEFEEEALADIEGMGGINNACEYLKKCIEYYNIKYNNYKYKPVIKITTSILNTDTLWV